MHFDFGGPLADMPKDTIFVFGARVARGIGIIEEQYHDFGGALVLQGAIIDGVQYGTIVSIDDAPENIPEKIALYQNYPNPFNPETTIRYDLHRQNKVELAIYDVLGRKIAVLVNKIQPPGSYNVQFDGQGLASGVYIYRLQTPFEGFAKKMILMQ